MSQTAIVPNVVHKGGESSSSLSSSLFFPSPMFDHKKHDRLLDDVKPSQSSHYSSSPRSSYMSRPSLSLAISPSMKNKRLIMIRVIRDRMSQINAILEKMERMEKMEQ
jgi:hypothetical protein